MAVLEEWRDVVGYEGLYEISDYGCVRSRHGGKVRYMKCKKGKNGYLRICLSKNGKGKTFLVHRLVYTVFNGTIAEGYEIDHIDGDKTNNNLRNLRAVTPRENQWNSVTRARYLEAMKKLPENQEWRNNLREAAKRRAENPHWLNNVRQGIKKALSKPVLQLDKDTGEVIREWPSAREAARALKLNQSNVSKCCLGKRYYKTVGGYRWCFCLDKDS